MRRTHPSSAKVLVAAATTLFSYRFCNGAPARPCSTSSLPPHNRIPLCPCGTLIKHRTAGRYCAHAAHAAMLCNVIVAAAAAMFSLQDLTAPRQSAHAAEHVNLLVKLDMSMVGRPLHGLSMQLSTCQISSWDAKQHALHQVRRWCKPGSSDAVEHVRTRRVLLLLQPQVFCWTRMQAAWVNAQQTEQGWGETMLKRLSATAGAWGIANKPPGNGHVACVRQAGCRKVGVGQARRPWWCTARWPSAVREPCPTCR